MVFRVRLVFVLFLLVASTSAVRGEVRIGLAGPMTGPMAWAGASNQVGAQSAVADLNAKGGVLGERIELVEVDDFCAPDWAAAAAAKLIDAGVVAVVGHHCSIASIPTSKMYADAGILMISPFSTNPKLTEQGLKTVFRICGRDDIQGRVAGDFLAERFGEKSIAILHDGLIYGRDLAGFTKKRLNERGVVETMFEAIDPDQVEYTDTLRKMQTLGVEVLYYAGFRREAGLLVRFAHDWGYRLQLVAGDGIGGEDFGLIAGPGADGTFMTYAPSPLANPGAAALAEHFAAKGYAGSFGLGTFRSYAVVQVWAEAAEHAGTFAADAVADALRELQFDTVLGRIGFDEKGDVTGYNAYVWYVWRDGEFAPLEDAPPAE